MGKHAHDFLVWYCDWCDSKHLVPWVLQHESRQFCPACAKQTVLHSLRCDNVLLQAV